MTLLLSSHGTIKLWDTQRICVLGDPESGRISEKRTENIENGDTLIRTYQFLWDMQVKQEGDGCI